MDPNRSVKDRHAVDSELPTILRFAVYTILIFSATSALPLILQPGDIGPFKEGAWIEWCQLLLLISSAGIYFYSAFLGSHHRSILHVLGCIALFAAIREMDQFLDALIPFVGWKIGWLIIPYVIFFAYINRSVLHRQMQQFLTTHAVVILWAGFLIVVPIAQLVGHGEFLESLMGDNYVRDYKRVIEESLELIGYVLILAGSVESKMDLMAIKTTDHSASQTGKLRSTIQSSILSNILFRHK